MDVELRAVTAGYGERSVIAGLSLELAAGTFTALLGANGSGKSTLLRAIAGLLDARGTIRFGADSASQLDRRERARRVAFLPQRCEIPHGFSVSEVVAMGRAPRQDGWLRPSPDDARVVADSLDACGLEGLADRPIEQLSGGEQQRAHLARVLAQGAPVLLLDEAASQLDVRHARECHDVVRAAVRSRGLTCLAAMHDLNAAARIADRVALLADGRVLAVGPPLDVMTPPLLERVFGAPVEVARTPDGRPMFSTA